MAEANYETFELYGGEVKVKFYPKSHIYKVTDEKYGLVDERVKGVTTYIGIKDKSMALVPWAGELIGMHLLDMIEAGQEITMEDVAKAMALPSEKKEEAADIGSRTHEWCEYFIKNQLGEPGYEADPELPEDQAMLLGVDSFLEFITQHDVKFISSERVVYSREHQYIGTMDFEAMIDGKLAVGDFKTSNGLYNSVLQQLSAYQAAAEEEAAHIGKPVKYETRYAVRLAKETEQEYGQRMLKKNAVKILQGKEPGEIKPYLPFEWIVEDGRETHERDLAGYMNAMALHQWDSETDFYKRNK